MTSNTIEYDDFAKLDLRVATIRTVDDIPKADKLFKLTVDLGEELGERTLVAGIKTNYTKEELLGRQIVVLTNLKPIKLRGVQSNGMLLAADVEGKAFLLAPDSQVSNGTSIH